MTQDGGDELGLAHMPSSALCRRSSTSLAQRGAEDLARSEKAELYFREGSEYYRRCQADRAIDCFTKGLALNPLHVDMLVALGDIYTNGDFEDYNAAFEHFRIAAELGNAEAQSALASMYRNGEGIAQNKQLAFFWQKKAALHGHPCDQRRLGLMYEHGVGVELDHQRAIFWYKMAADQGGYFEPSEMTELQTQALHK